MKLIALRHYYRIVKSGIGGLFLSLGCLYSKAVFATTQNIGSLASNIQSSFGSIALLITSGSYIAGFGFAVASILKFKAHKDNPTQIPVGTPVALLFIAVALIFMPSLFNIGGQTVFGSGMTAGGVTGVTDIAGT
ncbi:MAG: type IV secretion protein IcmD [Gammaproteobacteria bacterium]|nr:type IV secretion protein IcmD [Gammaproteobacteria bacterium]